jgi:hypothetical protein
LFIGFVPATALADATPTPHIVIAQVKLGGAVSGQPTEFVELFNDQTAAVDVTGWVLEYAKSTAELAPADCIAKDWQAIAGSSTVKQTELGTTTITSGGRVVVPLSLNDNAGGSLRLVQPAQAGQPLMVHDLVGWASASSPAPCKEGSATASVPPNGKSMQRKFNVTGHPIDTDQNGNDFVVEGQTQPSGTPSTDPTQPPAQTNPPGTPQCVGIVLSEILANPEGSDTDAEFIELYNSSAMTQSLAGCSLKTSSSSKQFALPADQTLAPGEYRAFYSSVTNLTITNTGGEVWLITPTTESIVQYPSANDDQAWAAFGNDWKATLTSTPDQPNVLTETLSTATANQTDDELAPCPAGKYRNPDTNRCKNIEAADTEVKPCDAGSERNPATNRCRSIAATLASLVPCAEGSERNAETNRCRKVATASSDLKPCNEGEERNATTNRCRKVAGASTTAAAAPPQASAPKSSLHYAAIAAVALGLLGYGAYEYRGDIGNLWAKVGNKK